MIKQLVLLAAAVFAELVVAGQIYDSHDEFYNSLPNRLFGEPIKQNRDVGYSIKGEEGSFSESKMTWGEREVSILLGFRFFTLYNADHYPIKTYFFKKSKLFPFETKGDNPVIYSIGADIFVLNEKRQNILCIESASGGSGESNSRYREIYLLISPKDKKKRETFLHLPALLSSCRAIRVGKTGNIIFPKNSYLFSYGTYDRIGLVMSYFSYIDGKFEPADERIISLKFIEPENPFRFRVE